MLGQNPSSQAKPRVSQSMRVAFHDNLSLLGSGPGPVRKLPSQEKKIFEAALSESGGRVYGPCGAAAELGTPRSTLEQNQVAEDRQGAFQDCSFPLAGHNSPETMAAVWTCPNLKKRRSTAKSTNMLSLRSELSEFASRGRYSCRSSGVATPTAVPLLRAEFIAKTCGSQRNPPTLFDPLVYDDKFIYPAALTRISEE